MSTSRRRQPRAAALAVVMIVAGLGGLVATGGPAPAVLVTQVTAARALAWEVQNNILTNLGPTPVVQVPPPACPANQQDDTATVLSAGGISVGLSHDEVACQPALPSADGFATANADVAFVGIASLVNLLPDVLRIDGVHAECRSGKQVDGSFGSIGDAQVAGIKVAGTPLNVGSLGANTVVDLTTLIGIKLTLNEQMVANTPTTTNITVNAVHLQVTNGGLLAGTITGIIGGLLPGGVTPSGELFLGHVVCGADLAQVDVTTTTTTTAAPATTTTTAPGATTTTTAPAATTTTTTAPGATTTTSTAPGATTTTTAAGTTTTAAPVTTTVPATTTTSPPIVITVPITSPPPGTILIPVTTPITQPPQQQILVRTGQNLQPIVVVSALSIVLGILLLIGSGRPLTANAGVSGTLLFDDGTPEKWGPREIAKTVYAGLAVLALGIAKAVKRRQE